MAAKKKLKINPKKTLGIALSIIGICVAMLFVSISLTQKNTNQGVSEAKIFSFGDNHSEKEKTIAKEKAKKANAASVSENKAAGNIQTQKEQVSEAPENQVSSKQEIKTKEQKQVSVNVSSGKAVSESSAKPQNSASVSETKHQVQKTNTAVTEVKSSSQNQVASAKITDAEKDKPKAAPGSKGYVVLILDDGGHNINVLQKYLELDMPLTVSVLPHVEHSVETARRVRLAGKELMLHQPMQAVNENVDPGEGAIRPNMDDRDVRDVLAENIAQIGPVAGMNNHEGSMITANESFMSWILEECDNRKIYFVDSRTNKDSVAKEVAQIKGMKIYERNTSFIDDGINGGNSDLAKQKANEALMLNRIKTGLSYAEKNGSVVMIGHVRSHNLDKILKDNYQAWVNEGYAFTTISKSGSKIK
jgi:polysaccharide deacetylase 2 family uncharacterized protein YibQ